VHLQDAFCLHLGAHRGTGGWVEGNDLVCPWHGWHWDGDGHNTLIPYSKDRCKPKLQIRTYPVQEWCGMILTWYGEEGLEPSWWPPKVAEYDDPRFYPMHPFSDRLYHGRGRVQMPIENAADPAHMQYVHGGSEMPEVLELVFDGH